MEVTAVKAKGGTRPGAGRKVGSRSTVPSTFVSRLRAQGDISQGRLAQLIDAREKTVWRYEKLGIIPVSGPKRAALEKLAKSFSIPLLDEPTP